MFDKNEILILKKIKIIKKDEKHIFFNYNQNWGWTKGMIIIIHIKKAITQKKKKKEFNFQI